MRFYDLAIPSQLTAALLPDLTLIVGAMILLLVAVWRRESAAHQPTVGVLSIGLAVVTLGTVLSMMVRPLPPSRSGSTTMTAPALRPPRRTCSSSSRRRE